MFTLEVFAVVVILGVTCHANIFLQSNQLIQNAIRAQNAMELQIEQQKQQQEMIELQYKAAEERRKLQLDLNNERLQQQLEQQQLQQEMMQQNMLARSFLGNSQALFPNTGGLQSTTALTNNRLTNPTATNMISNNLLTTSGASTTNLLRNLPNVNSLTGTRTNNVLRPLFSFLNRAISPQFAAPSTSQGRTTFTAPSTSQGRTTFTAPSTSQGRTTFTNGIQQTRSFPRFNNQVHDFLI